MQGAATVMHHADRTSRALRRFTLNLSAAQPPAIKPMAPTAPTASDDTLLASRTLISWKRCKNGELNELIAYMLKLWKIPDRMIHHIVGRPRTAANEDLPPSAELLVTTRPISNAPRFGSRMVSATIARIIPGMHAI